MLGPKVQKYTTWVITIAAGLTTFWAFWEIFALKNIEFFNVFTGSATLIIMALSIFVNLYPIELTEKRLKPYPYPYIESAGTPNLYWFYIKNAGETTAYNVYLKWKGNFFPKRFFNNNVFLPSLANGKDNAIAVLLPHERIFQLLIIPKDVVKQMITKTGRCKGYVIFKDFKGQKYKTPFILNVSSLRFKLFFYNDKESLQ